MDCDRIELYWHPAVNLKFNPLEPCYEIPDNHNSSWNDEGIYQVYGDHPVYGRDSLLYIGITEDTFRNRFNKHLKNFLGYHVNLSVRFCFKKDIDLQGRSLEEIESLLISSHMPALNKEYLHVPNKSVKSLIILNLSEAGDLMPVVSTVLFED